MLKNALQPTLLQIFARIDTNGIAVCFANRASTVHAAFSGLLIMLSLAQCASVLRIKYNTFNRFLTNVFL